VPGIHRLEDAYTNWYIVEDGGGLTIVDAGVPTSWDSLQGALTTLGRRRRCSGGSCSRTSTTCRWWASFV
jgi:glyoxylase-like metal-dependent hydrolase (beta-lactamase superfamily II)